MSDYTPGHAFNDISVVVPQINHEFVHSCLRRLYKDGHANERAAIVAELYAEAERLRAAGGVSSVTRTVAIAHGIEHGEFAGGVSS